MPGGGDYSHYNGAWQVYGSNNGEDWDLLFEGDWQSDGDWGTTASGYYCPKYKITITKDIGPYFYYKIGPKATGAWQTHHFEAFSQIPREVPK
jgi:hypothetical protein